MEQGEIEGNSMVITRESKIYLSETAKWGKLLAIIGFVMLGIMLIFGFSFGAIMNTITGPMREIEDSHYPDSMMNTMSTMMTIFYIVFAIIYFFPLYYLLKFSNIMKVALANDDETALTDSFRNLKSLYKFSGILALIIIGFQLIGLLMAVAGGIFG